MVSAFGSSPLGEAGEGLGRGDPLGRPYESRWGNIHRVFVVFVPPQRVRLDVIRDALQVFLVPNYMLVIIPLPDAGGVAFLVDAVRNGGFIRTDNCAQ